MVAEAQRGRGMIQSVTRKFQALWYWLVPGWLQRGEGERVQQVIGLTHDAFVERCRQTAVLDCPSYAPSDQLPLLGKDRGVLRGTFEPDASFRQRLLRWRWPRGHRIRGAALALLDQVSAAIRGTEWLTIDQRGTRYDYGSDAATKGVTWDWDDSALTPNWGRYWVVVKSTGSLPETWDEGEARGCLWDEPDDECYAGDGIHPGEIAGIRELASNGNRGWTPAGRRAVYLVIYFPGETFPAPDGTWNSWGGRPPFDYAFEPLNPHET